MLSRLTIRRLGTWSLAHAAIRVEEYLADYLLYPFMLYRGGPWIAAALGTPNPALGYWTGFGAMVLLSIAVNLAYLRLYDRLRIDWFGFEAAKTFEFRFAEVGLYRHCRPAVIAGVFTYLAIFHSPLFATLAVRTGAEPFEMRREDWRVFALALLLGNLGWAGVVTGAVEAWMRFVYPALLGVFGS